MRLLRSLLAFLNSSRIKISLWTKRKGDGWEAFWERKLFPNETWVASPYSSPEGFEKHITAEIRSLPREIWILLGSIMSGIGLISLLGYQANGPLVDFLISQFGETSHAVWNLILSFLPIELSESQAKILSINALAIFLYLRTVYIVERERLSKSSLDSVINQNAYFIFFWTLATIIVAALLSINTFMQMYNNQLIGDLPTWRRHVSAGSFALLAFILATIAMWIVFFVYFLAIFQSRPVTWVRTLAIRRPVYYAALNLAIPPVTFIALFYAIPLMAQWIPLGAVKLFVGTIGWILYLHIFSVFLSSLTFPRVFFALISVILGLLILDNVLP